MKKKTKKALTNIGLWGGGLLAGWFLLKSITKKEKQKSETLIGVER